MTRRGGADPAEGDRFRSLLLVALPQLIEPTFRRSVILVGSHDEAGAMGFVMNRPLPATVSEVLEGLGLTWNGPAEASVWSGGPVMPEAGWVLFGREKGLPEVEADEIVPGLFLSASIDTLRTLAAKPPRSFKLMLGYAGWGAGQLESEVMEGSWLVASANASFLLDTPSDQLWPRTYEQLGIAPGLIVPSEGVQ